MNRLQARLEHKANNCQTCCECCDDLMPDWAGLAWPGNKQHIAAAQKPQIGPDAAADGGYCRTTAGPQTGPGMTHAGNHNVTATATAGWQARRLTGNKWCMQICGMLQNVHILTHHSQVSHATGFFPVRFSTYFIHFLRLDAAVFCATNADRTFSFVFIIISTHHKRTFYCTQLKIKPNYGVKDCVRTQTLYCVWP